MRVHRSEHLPMFEDLRTERKIKFVFCHDTFAFNSLLQTFVGFFVIVELSGSPFEFSKLFSRMFTVHPIIFPIVCKLKLMYMIRYESALKAAGGRPTAPLWEYAELKSALPFSNLSSKKTLQLTAQIVAKIAKILIKSSILKLYI